MMAELLGKATGTNKGKGGTMHIADINKGMLVPTELWARTFRCYRCGPERPGPGFRPGERRLFGDGAVNQGQLHEALNLAAIWKLPVLFVCENNRYAEATPFEYAVAGGSVADRAPGYDMPGVQVDGQSALDMYEVGGEAVKRARAGEGSDADRGPDLQIYGHFGADNSPPLQTEEEEAYYRDRDCIKSLAAHILESGVATEAELEQMDQDAGEAAAAAAKFANESPFPSPDELFDDVYSDYPREALIAGTQPEGLADPGLIEPPPPQPTAESVGKSG